MNSSIAPSKPSRARPIRSCISTTRLRRCSGESCLRSWDADGVLRDRGASRRAREARRRHARSHAESIDSIRVLTGKLLRRPSSTFSIDICEAVMDDARSRRTRDPVILNLPATVEVSTPNLYADQIELFRAARSRGIARRGGVERASAQRSRLLRCRGGGVGHPGGCGPRGGHALRQR